MEYLKTLRNNNVIYSGTRNTKYNQQTTSDFSIRFVFSGNERYSIGKRQLSIYTDSFLILNKGTQYSSTAESAIPVQSFGISFDDVKTILYWALVNTHIPAGTKTILMKRSTRLRVICFSISITLNTTSTVACRTNCWSTNICIIAWSIISRYSTKKYFKKHSD